MAILSRYPGLTVNVKVGGELAKEYDAPAEEVEAGSEPFEFHKLNSRIGGATPYSLSYIEAKPGEPFEFVFDTRSINLYDGEKPERFRMTAVLDGFTAHPKLLKSEVNTFSKCLTGNPATGYSETTFKFASLDLCRIILAGLILVEDMCLVADKLTLQWKGRWRRTTSRSRCRRPNTTGHSLSNSIWSIPDQDHRGHFPMRSLHPSHLFWG